MKCRKKYFGIVGENMKLIICLDNNNGVLFNGRRVSKDKNVVSDIQKMITGSNLICSQYSSELFVDDITNNLIVSDKEISELTDNGYYFVENIMPSSSLKFEEVIIYKWNREYPSDLKFEFDLKDYFEVNRLDFAGNSHERITKIILRGADKNGSNI